MLLFAAITLQNSCQFGKTVFKQTPKTAILSATLHSYLLFLWSNYGYGKKKMLSSRKVSAFRKTKKERKIMSSKNNNQINIPQAREAMDRFKMQAAQEVGVNLQNGYNGHLTSREAGSVGGQMVKKMIEAYEQGLQ
jgi:small acid-soluble spore protein D (minor alpha/beta-type SASP)